MQRKLMIVFIAIIFSYIGYRSFFTDPEFNSEGVALLASEWRSIEDSSSQGGAEFSDPSPVVAPSISSSNNFSSRSSIALQESKHSINNQLKLLAQAYKPNAEVIASVERFETIQFELLEEIDEIILMQEGDLKQAEDSDEMPAYAENKAHKSDDVYELSQFTQFRGECFRIKFIDAPACNAISGVDFRRLSVLTPLAIDKLDKLALQGDLLAQSLYHASLLSAVDSFDMNTARDTELWLQRRQRMIGYSLKFAKAGSAQAVKRLAKLYDGGDYIERSPFWAAVFFSQLSLIGNEGGYELQRLISKNDLDENELEQARQSLFDDD